MDRETFFFSSLMSMIFASTSWPMVRTLVRLGDAMVRDLGDVDQAVHARNDLSKCAEGHELEDLDGRGVADLEVGGEDVPRVVLRTLVAQGDLLVLAVERDDIDVDMVTDVDDLGRMLDAAPGQLGDVDHAVHAADVNKCAVGGQALDRALVLCADLDGLPNLLGSRLAGLLLHLTDGADNALALAVDLGDVERLLGLDQLAHGLILGHAGLGRRDKDAHAVCGCDDAAAVLLDDQALNRGVLFLGCLDGLPALELVNALLGQGNGALEIVYTDNNCLDLVAGLDVLLDLVGRVVGQLGYRDICGVLDAQVNLHLGRGHSDDRAGDFISII